MNLLRAGFFLSYALSCANQNAWGQSSDQDARHPAELEEIVVTAQKRSENLQKVPIAVTVLDSSRIEAAGAQDVQGLAAALPGVQMLNLSGAIVPRVRGVGSGVSLAGVESPVATYVDGVYMAYGLDVNVDLFDVQQVSLVKGPQGTLFGRNATGGVMQIDTRDPQQDFYGMVRVGLDNYLTSKVDAFVSGGLSSNVSGSLAASVTHQEDGYGENTTTGTDTYRTDHAVSVRGKLKIELDPDTTIHLAADYADRGGPMTMNFRPVFGTQTAYPVSQPSSAWDTASNTASSNDYQGGGIAATIDHDFGFAKLTSISAYRHSELSLDFTPVPTVTKTLNLHIPEGSEQITQEIQLSSTSSSPLSWTVGAFYFYNRAYSHQTVAYSTGFAANLAALSDGAIVYPFTNEDIDATQWVRSIAGYAQSTYHVTDSTRLTAGIRYTAQWTDYTGIDTGFLPNGAPILVGSLIGAHNTFEKPTWRLALDQDLAPDVVGYISYNRGVKSGGYNLRNATNPAFLPEQLDAYEVGIKSQFADQRVRLNVAAFYYKYDNIQVPAFSAVIIIRNGAAAEIYGTDVDLDVQVTDRLKIVGGASWLHAKFTSFPNAGTTVELPDGQPDLGNPTYNASGNDVPYSPHYTATLGPTYSLPTKNGDFTFNATDNYNSGFFSEADNFLHQKAYQFLDASVVWTAPSKRVSVRAYVNNILNEAVVSQYATIAGFAYIADYTNPPRIYGGSVTYNFK